MVPDLTLEVIYLDQPTDFKMEFELCSSSNVRFLSMPVKTHGEFLNVISKSVIRSRAIVVVGSFNPLDKLYIPKIIAKATGYELKEVEKEKFGIDTKEPVFLPESSLPLVDTKGKLGGCVLESNDQSIIMLTSDRELRQYIVSNLVCPYLKLFANKTTKPIGVVPTPGNVETAKAEENLPVQSENEQNITEPTEKQSVTKTHFENENNLSEQPVDYNSEVAIATGTVAATVIDEVENQDYQQSEQQKEVQPDTEPPQYSVLDQPVIEVVPPFNLDGFLIDDDDETRKPKKLKAFIKILISIILVLAVLIGSYFGYEYFFQPTQRESIYEEIRSLYGQGWDKLPEDMLHKFGKLYQTNSDIYGWISVPNTSINLPVVSAAAKSPGYYQSHLFEGSPNRYGTLYTTAEAAKDAYSRSVVIYGKNTGDNAMFSELDMFLNVEQYKVTPTFTFDTVYAENTWKIFSVFEISKNDKNNYFDTELMDDSEFSEHLKFLEKSSIIDTDIDVTSNDKFVTLVSQSEKTNIVLVARSVRDGESPMVDITGVTANEDINNSSDIPVVANPLKPIEESSVISEDENFVDSNIVDGAQSRYEQQAPVTSLIPLKPISPTITSVPEISSDLSNDYIGSETDSTVTSDTESVDSSEISSDAVTSDTTTNDESSDDEASVAPSSVTATSKATSSKKSDAVSSVASSPTSSAPELTVTNTLTGAKVSGSAVNIVAQNIEAEMGPGYHSEALKAQAVAAYSWLLNNGAASGKAPKLPLKTPSQKCLNAAKAVAGQVAVYKGEVATTFYFAISAGRTANSKDIWDGSIPYCVSVDSSIDESVSGFKTVRKYSADTVAKIAKDLLKIDLKSIKDKNKWFSCTYDANGVYCSKIKIGSVSKKGTYMRDTFFSSSRVGASNVLRSSAYTIEYDEKTDTFIFTVKGYGHGVGMSQSGANLYAKKGWNYEKILKHYYTGITIGTY